MEHNLHKYCGLGNGNSSLKHCIVNSKQELAGVDNEHGVFRMLCDYDHRRLSEGFLLR